MKEITKPGFYSEEEGKEILNIARESINEEFSKNFEEKIKKLSEKAKFKQLRGVFVTLHCHGKLRGCIGFPYASFSVFKAVYEAAKQSAFSDSRFPPLKESELKDINIEISVLTNPEQISDIKKIIIGRDGLICNYLSYSGLLLPQVATEYPMSKLEFVEALCEKAGLPKDTWQRKNFNLFRFQAQIFRE